MDTVDYRFRTIESAGSVQLTDHSVVAHIRHRGSHWSHEIPYPMLYPYPLRVTSIPAVFWMCLLIGTAGLAGGLWGIVDNLGTNMTSLYGGLLALGGAALIGFGLRNRREEWLVYSSVLQGHSVRFCRNGPCADSFDSFTEQLTSRIRSARKSE
jgi:hypothetical protein